MEPSNLLGEGRLRSDDMFIFGNVNYQQIVLEH